MLGNLHICRLPVLFLITIGVWAWFTTKAAHASCGDYVHVAKKATTASKVRPNPSSQNPAELPCQSPSCGNMPAPINIPIVPVVSDQDQLAVCPTEQADAAQPCHRESLDVHVALLPSPFCTIFHPPR